MQWGIRIAGMNLTELERIIHTARTVLDAGGGGAPRIESAMLPSRQRRKPGPWWAAESSAAKRHAVPSQSGQDGTHKRLRPRALTQDEKDRATWELWERTRAIDIEVVHDVLELERWSLEGAEQKLRQLGFSPGAAEGDGATRALGPNGGAAVASENCVGQQNIRTESQVEKDPVPATSSQGGRALGRTEVVIPDSAPSLHAVAACSPLPPTAARSGIPRLHGGPAVDGLCSDPCDAMGSPERDWEIPASPPASRASRSRRCVTEQQKMQQLMRGGADQDLARDMLSAAGGDMDRAKEQLRQVGIVPAGENAMVYVPIRAGAGGRDYQGPAHPMSAESQPDETSASDDDFGAQSSQGSDWADSLARQDGGRLIRRRSQAKVDTNHLRQSARLSGAIEPQLSPSGRPRRSCAATPPSVVIPQSDQRCVPPEQLYRGRTQKPWLCETCNEKEHLCPGPPRAFT